MSDTAVRDPDAGAFGLDRSNTVVLWKRQNRVSWGFRFERYVTGFLLLFLPPASRRMLFAWLWIPLLALIGFGWVWYVGYQVPGNTAVDGQVRSMAYIIGSLIGALALFGPSGTSEARGRRRDPFRSGRIERTAVIGGSFAVQRGPKRWIPLRITAIRRIRRLLGVVAIQLPSGRYWLVPSTHFPSRAEWRELRDQVVGYPIG
ncbi:MAG TPA: hypothetical protein VGF80_09345 [Galbitalea sp.]